MTEAAKLNKLKKYHLRQCYIVLALLISFLFNGYVSELIQIFGLCYLMYLNAHNLRRKKSTRVGFYVCSFIIVVICLFFIQIFLFKIQNVIRLYGLTKCILMPGVMILCFYGNRKYQSFLFMIRWFLIFANIAYFVVCVLQKNSYVQPLGSINVIGGINAILLPFVFLSYRNGKQTDMLLYLIVILLNAVFFDATTYKILVCACLIFGCFKVLFKNRWDRTINIVLVLSIIAIIVLPLAFVMGGKVSENNFLYRARIEIWVRCFEAFKQLDIFRRLFGTGNNMVHMETVVLEAHNVTLDILMIYGIIGVVVTSVFLCLILLYLYKNRRQVNYQLVLLEILLYLVVCFLNPFFTGVLWFQFVCMLCIIASVRAKCESKTRVRKVKLIYER